MAGCLKMDDISDHVQSHLDSAALQKQLKGAYQTSGWKGRDHTSVLFMFRYDPGMEHAPSRCATAHSPSVRLTL